MKKKTKTLLILLSVVLLLILSGCIYNPKDEPEDDGTGCNHNYVLLDKVEAKNCKTSGYADYECSICGKHKHERLFVQHSVSNKKDYISLQYCSKCKEYVRLNPEGTIDKDFYYCYKESMMENFNIAIDNCRAKLQTANELMTEDEKKALSDEVDELYGLMLDEYNVIKDQYAVAEINFYCENNDTTSTIKENIEKIKNECSESHRKLYYDCFHSPLQKYLFEGEDLEKIEKQIENFQNPEITELSNAINELEMDLYFPEEELTDIEFAEGYKDLLDKRNSLAKLYNYDNYYEYSHFVEYGREYDINQVEKFREYVSKYIPDLVSQYYNTFYYSATTSEEAYYDLISIVNDDMFANPETTSLYVDYLKYMSTSDLNFYDEVNNAFKEGRVYFGGENGVEAAFTTSILDDTVNVMFFYIDPYYSCPSTVVHETGHFMFTSPDYSDYDLFEVQSQTNEFLFATYLRKNSSLNCNAYIPYMLYSNYHSILSSTAVDEFEYALYTNYSDLADKYKDGIDYTEYDSLFGDICDKYEIEEKDVGLWHYYATQSSCYEISYAISLVPVIAKYKDAVTNLKSARNDYIKLLTFYKDEDLTKEDDELLTFNEVLAYCNFANPFDENTFKSFTK